MESEDRANSADKQGMQELFDRVARHLLTQGRPSRNSNGDCAYRGEGGLACAIGCLIADEQYSDDLEGWKIFRPSVRLAVEKSLGRALVGYNYKFAPSGEFDLLNQLQRVHDKWVPERWRHHLGAIARGFGLSATAVRGLPNEETHG